MSNYRKMQSSFIAGVLSPIQEANVGTTAYAAGLSVAENVFYGLNGGVFKRNGTRLGALALTDDSVVYSFFCQGKVLAIEFGNKTARLIDSSGTVLGSAVTTPYFVEDVRELSCSSFLDTLYVTHRKYPPASFTVVDNQLQPPKELEFVQSQSATATEGVNRTVCKTFDSEGNYPAFNLFYGGRWYLHSTDNEPLTIWASRTFDSVTGEYRFNDFTLELYEFVPDGEGGGSEQQSMLADLAFAYLSSNMAGAASRWFFVHQSLLVGTANSVFSDGGNSAVTATTESPFNLSVAMEYGSSLNKAVAIGSYIFFAAADNRSVMCAAYSQQYNAYSGADISESVSVYLDSGIKRIAAISSPMPSLWVLTNDGTLLCCYFVQGQITAWSVMTFTDNDHPLWIEEIQGGNDGRSYLMLIMDRAGVRTIETLENISPANLWKCINLDCYVKNTAFPLSSRSAANLDIEYNEEEKRHTYISTAAEKDPDADRYSGLNYAAVVGNLRAELPANGTSQSTVRGVTSVILRLYKSYGGIIAARPDLDNSEEMFVKDRPLNKEEIFRYWRYGSKEYGSKNTLFTGEVQADFNLGNVSDDRFIIRSCEPFPFCITALIVNYSVVEA